MNTFNAIFLGLIQGATEFLPISSSAHLVLAAEFFHIEGASLTFDVSLHMGTLLAVITYFRHDLIAMLAAVCRFSSKSAEDVQQRKLIMLIAVSTVPAVFAGLLLEDLVENSFRSPALISCTLVIFGALLLWSEKRGQQRRDFTTFTLADAIIIGLAQALAIIPGVSRSGITMTTGLFRNLDRSAVAKFSFLMSIPVIGGAGLLSAIKVAQQGLINGHLGFYLSGFIISAVSGYLFIAFLMKYIQTKSFAIFAYYRFLLAGVILLKLLL